MTILSNGGAIDDAVVVMEPTLLSRFISFYINSWCRLTVMVCSLLGFDADSREPPPPSYESIVTHEETLEIPMHDMTPASRL